MKRLLKVLAVLAAIGAVVLWLCDRQKPSEPEYITLYDGRAPRDPEDGHCC